MKDSLKVDGQNVTLVDHVEDKLLAYFKTQNLHPGDSIPNELELAAALGVARSVLREALSRLKMMGMIESRTRRGMILTEPSILEGMSRVADPRILSEDSMFDILRFRMALEIGICDEIFENITKEDIKELSDIVKLGGLLRHNEYTLMGEYHFHSKLYQITGNQTIVQFQDLIRPIITFIKDNFQDMFKSINVQLKKEGRIVTHADLLRCIKKEDVEEYKTALNNHFLVYKIFLKERKKSKLL